MVACSRASSAACVAAAAGGAAPLSERQLAAPALLQQRALGGDVKWVALWPSLRAAARAAGCAGGAWRARRWLQPAGATVGRHAQRKALRTAGRACRAGAVAGPAAPAGSSDTPASCCWLQQRQQLVWRRCRLTALPGRRGMRRCRRSRRSSNSSCGARSTPSRAATCSRWPPGPRRRVRQALQQQGQHVRWGPGGQLQGQCGDSGVCLGRKIVGGHSFDALHVRLRC
jgi:hypothetical protein